MNDSKEGLSGRVKPRRKKRLNIFKFARFLFLVFLIAVLAKAAVHEVLNWHGLAFIGKDINLKTTQVPEYVDVQMLDIGNARTGEKLREVSAIVVHYVGNPATTAQNNHDYFAKEDTHVCSHFVIGINGEIIQCVPIDEKSAASNNRNIDTISIEVCHPDKSGKFTDASVEALVKLCRWLCENSGLKRGDVIRHYDVTGKKCPLYYVDDPNAWDELVDKIFDSR